MKVIADAGGTSTHWSILEGSETIDHFQTRGLNLMHHHPEDYFSSILEAIFSFKDATVVHFYVAGYFKNTTQSKALEVAIKNAFSKSKIHIYSDLMAAAHALCGHQSGWIGILGTGANVARYNGNEIVQQVAPLGYLLGDEGSGAFLGKEFLKLLLRNQIEEKIAIAFSQRFGLKKSEILPAVYEKNDPKLFLSSLATFLIDFKHEESIYQLITRAFSLHLEVFLTNKKDDQPIHYTGSVAYHFSDVLREVASLRDLPIGQITKDPVAGLAIYHRTGN